MDEQFLHYIWKYQKFHNNPRLVDGQEIAVFYQGNHNHDSGPDFEEARIKIGDIEWAGQVEIHINSSDWIHHNHQTDPSYENVILHVVWNHNKDILIEDSPIPTLEIKNLVKPELVDKYHQHVKKLEEIPCSGSIRQTSDLTIQSMLSRVLVERLENKADRILNDVKSTKYDWEETTFKALTTNFGFSVNKEAFIRLAEVLPFGKVKKELHNLKKTEALFFGQAGFLDGDLDKYQAELKVEHTFLSKKHRLKDSMVRAQWKFGKLRPPNFPSVRLAQLSSIFHNNPKLFALLIETSDIVQLKDQLLTSVSDYWQIHYDFTKGKKNPRNTMGLSSFENILINTVAPLLAAYSKYTAEQQYMDRAVELLESLQAEKNRITRKWDELKFSSKNAFDSQASIELYKSYCQKRKCLSCNIGVEILNQ